MYPIKTSIYTPISCREAQQLGLLVILFGWWLIMMTESVHSIFNLFEY